MQPINQEILITHIKMNQNKFYRLSYSYLHNEADAKDAIQNAIVKAFENFSSVKDKKYLSTWFYRILVNECNAILRKKKNIIFESDAMIEEIADEKDEVSHYHQKQQLQEVIEKMNPDLRIIIILHFYEEKTLSEISEITKQPLSTIKSRLYRGLQLLRIQMDEEEYV